MYLKKFTKKMDFSPIVRCESPLVKVKNLLLVFLRVL